MWGWAGLSVRWSLAEQHRRAGFVPVLVKDDRKTITYTDQLI